MITRLSCWFIGFVEFIEIRGSEMGIFNLGRKSHWVSYVDWQREVYAKTARAVIDNSVRGQPIKTSATAATLTLTLFVNPEHPDADDMPKVMMRPAAEGQMEVVVNDKQIARFKMPQPPEKAVEQFQVTISEVFKNLMPMPLRPAGNDTPGQVAC
ncbi:MAG: hypothetical protein AAFX02_01415 [Pseudomonadota bacterium]